LWREANSHGFGSASSASASARTASRS
jgi:hypothetical protein